MALGYDDYMCYYHWYDILSNSYFLIITLIFENAEKIRRCGAQAHLKAFVQKYPEFKRSQDPQPKQIQIEINLADKSRHSTQQIAQENHPLPQ